MQAWLDQGTTSSRRCKRLSWHRPPDWPGSAQLASAEAFEEGGGEKGRSFPATTERHLFQLPPPPGAGSTLPARHLERSDWHPLAFTR